MLILITTSDYLPQLGGLSTFTIQIEKSLQDLGLSYEIFHWKNFEEINQHSNNFSKYSLIINIHPQFAWLTKTGHEKMINFIHGSEILMTSPNIFKKFYKTINKSKFFKKLEACHLNVFISKATQQKAVGLGYSLDYSRDIVFHNCIDTSDAKFVKKEIRNDLTFSCIARNVPHKNLQGTLEFCEMVKKITGRNVELIVSAGIGLTSSEIKITRLISSSNEERDEAYQRSHFNLLLSLDHSKRGFYEGFGLTVLEAGRFGTPSIVMNSGGLPEAVHHGETGWVIPIVSENAVKEIFNRKSEYHYYKMAIDCFEHTRQSHSLNEYNRFLEMIASYRRTA
jgi:glycosyltransferase involved in cell wall biosynthesis